MNQKRIHIKPKDRTGLRIVSKAEKKDVKRYKRVKSWDALNEMESIK